MKKAIVLGGGGFIGGHLGKKLKNDGYHVRIADIKNHEFWDHKEICHEFIKCDLTDPKSVELVISENADEKLPSNPPEWLPLPPPPSNAA